MTLIEPTFDPATRTWFTDCGAEARTISALLVALPPGTRVRDYHPCGYVAVRECASPERGRDQPRLRPSIVDLAWRTRAPVAQVAPRRRVSAGGKNRKYDHDAVLNLWAAGRSVPSIAAALSMERPAICSVVQYARGKGDARAMKADDPRRAACA